MDEVSRQFGSDGIVGMVGQIEGRGKIWLRCLEAAVSGFGRLR